jgi:hypothetical protein
VDHDRSETYGLTSWHLALLIGARASLERAPLDRPGNEPDRPPFRSSRHADTSFQIHAYLNGINSPLMGDSNEDWFARARSNARAEPTAAILIR